MNPLLLLKWWREISIAALAVLFLGAAHSCSTAKEEVSRIKAEDSALAENQRRQNEQKARADKQAYEDSIHDYQTELAHLRDDTRVAHLVCEPAPRRSPVSIPSKPAAGTPTDKPADVLPEAPRDFGPAIGELMHQCDDLAVRHAALVNWVNSTR